MNKFLIVKFKDAKLFRNKKSKDYIFDKFSRRQRDGEPQFVEDISVFQISNMIHVLFNERPVSSMKQSLYPRCEYYFDKANQSYIKYDNTKKYNNSKKEFQNITETLSTKKAVYNSYNPSVKLNWEIMKRYCGEHYNHVVSLINTTYNIDSITLSLYEVIELIRNSDITKFETLKDYCYNNGLSGFLYAIDNDKSFFQMTVKKETVLTVNNGIEIITKLSGQILIPVSEEDLVKLSNYKGCATLLDGGFVWIDSVVNSDRLSIDGFKLVSELSIERV